MAADEDFGTAAATERIGTSCPEEIDGVGEIATEDEIRFAAIVVIAGVAGVAVTGADDQVIEAVAVDITGTADVRSGVITMVPYRYQKTVGAV